MRGAAGPELGSSPASPPPPPPQAGFEKSIPIHPGFTERTRNSRPKFYLASLLIMLASCAGLALFCVAADRALALPAVRSRLWLAAATDNAAHGVIGAWSWAIAIGGLRDARDLAEALLVGLLASLVDVDHFLAAGSLSLQAAVSLPRRPPLHCSTLIPVLCFLLWVLGPVFPRCGSSLSPSLPAWMLFVAMATHHVRDGARHGLALCPLGRTPPVPYWAYVGTTAVLPLLCAALMRLAGTTRRAGQSMTAKRGDLDAEV